MEIELSRLIDALPGLVWTTLPDGTGDAANQRWREYAGLTLDDVRRRGWKSAIHPDDLPQAQARWDAFLAAGAPGEVEARLRRFDGEYRRFAIKTFPLADASGGLVGWCGMNTEIEDRRRAEDLPDRIAGPSLEAIQDVTENKIAEEALEASEAELRLAEEALNRARAQLAHVARITALSTLTASIAHEVNQPLAGIITNASTCLRMLAADPPNLEGARATAQRTIRDGNRASEVIQRLRALFARKAPSIEPVDLNDAAREVLALSSSDLQRRRVNVRTDLADDLPPVRGDRVQLQQVILNLILNAADAMSGVDDRPRDLWLATAWDEPGQVTLSVHDAGPRVEPENLERLFDAFYTTKPEGMGIGLSISRSIIQAHEGRLWANANDGPGMTFSFAIPCGSERASEPSEACVAARAQFVSRET